MDYLDQMADHLIKNKEWLFSGAGIFLVTLFGTNLYNKIWKRKRRLEIINDLIIELQYNIIELQHIKSSAAFSLCDATWRLVSGTNLYIPSSLLRRVKDVYMKIRSAKDIQRSIKMNHVRSGLTFEMLKVDKYLMEIKESIPKLVTDLKSIIIQDISQNYFMLRQMNYPLVYKEYLEQRRKWAIEKGLGAAGAKAVKPA